MKKFKITILSVLIILLLSAVLPSCSKNKLTEPQLFLEAKGSDFILNGNKITLKGVNAGGWLIQESWMCPTELTDQQSMIKTLIERFGEEKADELLNVYLDNWWQESDFDNIKALGFNAVRLPFAYFDMLDGDYNLKKDAFRRLDFFISCCKKRDIFVIPVMHGAVGSQNGKDHSGDVSGAGLFDNDIYKEATLNLWTSIAEHYKDETAIVGYDLLNEPQNADGKTGMVQWQYYNQLYKAVREIDTNHIIFMEGTWDPVNLPIPALYKWQNISYSYHHYCWDNIGDLKTFSNFIDGKISDIKKFNYNVPVFIGEFTAFNNYDSWRYALKSYNCEGYSWCFWCYKVCGKGSSWGLFTADIEKADLKNDSFEEIKNKWQNSKTENFSLNENLYNAVKDYL